MKQELWKAIPGIDGYIASNTGKIMSLPKLATAKQTTGKIGTNGKAGKVLSPRPLVSTNHLQVGLVINGKRKHMYVHRLVATAWLKSRRGCELVLHRDDNPLNNHVSNLKLGTHYQNSNMITNRNSSLTRGNMDDSRKLVTELFNINVKNYSGTVRELIKEIANDLILSPGYVNYLLYQNNTDKIKVNRQNKKRLLNS